MARPYPKRAAGVAMINALGGLANLWSSYLYYNPPAYYTAFGTGRLRFEFWPKLGYVVTNSFCLQSSLALLFSSSLLPSTAGT
jgi:hypothetical protein